MRKLFFLFFVLPFVVHAQELTLSRATMQTINSGASPSSVTNYRVIVKKAKKFNWSVDSVCSVLTGESVKYNFVSVDDPDAVSPKYTAVKVFSKTDKGAYLITFGVTKRRDGGGRPGSPQNTKVDTTNIEGGVIIYYHAKGKKKQLKVIEFEQLETINAP